MKTGIVIIALIAIASTAYAQKIKLAKQSLSANGFSTTTQANLRVSQTIAQPSLVNAFSQRNIILLQGFESIARQGRYTGPESAAVTLFPNPCRGRLSIHHLPNENQVKIEVYDLKGVLAAEHLISPDINSSAEIDLSAIASGTYTVVLLSSHSTIRKILVIL